MKCPAGLHGQGSNTGLSGSHQTCIRSCCESKAREGGGGHPGRGGEGLSSLHAIQALPHTPTHTMKRFMCTAHSFRPDAESEQARDAPSLLRVEARFSVHATELARSFTGRVRCMFCLQMQAKVTLVYKSMLCMTHWRLDVSVLQSCMLHDFVLQCSPAHWGQTPFIHQGSGFHFSLWIQLYRGAGMTA